MVQHLQTSRNADPYSRRNAVLKAIREDSVLTCFERCLLRTVEDFADLATGHASPTIPMLASACGVSVRTIDRLIPRLVQVQWLLLRSGRAQSIPNGYLVTIPGAPVPKTTLADMPRPLPLGRADVTATVVATSSGSWSRANYATVLARDGNACRYCGAFIDLCFDHVTPRCQGGDDSEGNLVVACRPCNGRKGGRTPEEAGMVLMPIGARASAGPMDHVA